MVKQKYKKNKNKNIKKSCVRIVFYFVAEKKYYSR